MKQALVISGIVIAYLGITYAVGWAFGKGAGAAIAAVL